MLLWALLFSTYVVAAARLGWLSPLGDFEPFFVMLPVFVLPVTLLSIRLMFSLRLSPSKADTILTERAEQTAEKLGVRSGQVEVIETDFGKANAAAFVRKDGRIFISRKLVEEATPEELDFALAHELSHLKRPAGMRYAVLCSVFLAVLAVLDICFIAAFDLLSDWQAAVKLLSGPIALIAAVVWETLILSRQLEYGADVQALMTTGDVDAAVSCLSKMAKHSRNPNAHEQAFWMEHPPISRRIAALQQAAREKGFLVDNAE